MMNILFCLMSFFCVSVVLASDFAIGIANSLQKISCDGSDIGKLDFSGKVGISLARDESESFQIVIIPEKELKSVNVEIDSKALPDGITVKWYKVGYVRTGNPSYSVERVGLWPDPLFTVEKFSVDADKVQPIWVTITAGVSAKVGMHRLKVKIVSGSTERSVDVFVMVRNFILPRPGTFAAPFGLYMKKIAEWYYGKGKELKIEDFYRWCEFISKNYRLTPKNIGYEYVRKKYERLPDGRRVLKSVDMSELKRTVGKLAGEYFPDYSFGFYRLPSGTTIQKVLKRKKADVYLKELIAPIKIYYDEWKRLSLPEKVYIYGVDEPSDTDGRLFMFLSKLYSEIKRMMPDAKIMQTGNCDNSHLTKYVDIWCPQTVRVFLPFFRNQLSKGDLLWCYVCVSPIRPYANFFIDEPAIDHRILFWLCKKAGGNGFLYWSVAWWDGFVSAYDAKNGKNGGKCFPDIMLDVRNHCQFRKSWVHVNGDGFLLYPGKNLEPIPSIRIEIIRDGIEDVEYINLLAKLIDKVKRLPVYRKKGNIGLIKEAERLANVPDDIVSSATVYTYDYNRIFERRDKIADMIEQLTDILMNADYKLWK